MVDGLRGLGARIEATEDGFAVEGTGGLRGGVLEAHGDHRLAMLGAVAGLASRDGVEVIGMEAAAVSYPGLRGRPRGAARLMGQFHFHPDEYLALMHSELPAYERLQDEAAAATGSGADAAARARHRHR